MLATKLCSVRKIGQRCSGRNYNGKRCCTPENPCDEGEGDCDGPGDGGSNDGHLGCKGDLVCGSNNCLQFGAYFHPKDDCCERPSKGGGQFSSATGGSGVRQQEFGGYLHVIMIILMGILFRLGPMVHMVQLQ